MAIFLSGWSYGGCCLLREAFELRHHLVSRGQNEMDTFLVSHLDTMTSDLKHKNYLCCKIMLERFGLFYFDLAWFMIHIIAINHKGLHRRKVFHVGSAAEQKSGGNLHCKRSLSPCELIDFK